MYSFNQNRQQTFEQYAQANDTGDYSRIDPDQAMQLLQQLMHTATPEVLQGLFQQYFQQMPAEQRVQFAQQMPPQYFGNPNDPRQMAQGFQRMSQQQPDMLSQLFSQGGPLSNPLVKAAAVGVAALAAKQFLGGNQQRGGSIGDLLGGMLGGGQRDRDDDRNAYRRGSWGDNRGGSIGGLLGGGQQNRYRDNGWNDDRRGRGDWDNDYDDYYRDRRGGDYRRRGKHDWDDDYEDRYRGRHDRDDDD